MDNDPSLRAVQEILDAEEIKPELFRAALQLLAHDDSDTKPHALVTLESGESDEQSVSYWTNSVHRRFDAATLGRLGYEGVEAVELSYLPPRTGKGGEEFAEAILMKIDDLGGEEHILKMQIEDPGVLENIDTTSITKTPDGRYDSHEATVDDLHYVEGIVQSL